MKGKKRKARLQRRIQAWHQIEAKKRAGGAYKCPGSYSR